MATFQVDPLTGEIKETRENTSVAERVTGLMSVDSPLMRQARASGDQQANRRGLLSSSMGIQASEAEAYRVALPIASQDASQAQQRQLQQREFGQQHRLQSRDFDQQRAMLEMELGSRERLQQAEMAAQKERLGMQITSQEKMALQDLEAAEKRLQQQLQHQAQQSGFDRAQQETISQRNTAAQDIISQRNVNASDRQSAASMIASFEQTYAQTIASIMNNPDIPAAERQRYMDHAAEGRDNNIRMTERMYGFTLDWEGGQTPIGNNAQPTPTPIPTNSRPPADPGDMAIYEQALAAGMTVDEAAQAFGLRPEQINTWLQEQGLSLPTTSSRPAQQQPTPRTNEPIHPADLELYNQAKANGWNVRQAAEAFGMTVERINDWLASHGLTL